MTRAERAADRRTCHYTRHEWQLIDSREPSADELVQVRSYRCRACDARTERRVPDTPRIDIRAPVRRLLAVPGPRWLVAAAVALLLALAVIL